MFEQNKLWSSDTESSQPGPEEEFGLPEFKDHLADEMTPAILRDWTARDFASIYVRFRPHLDRHAKRFLANPSQVEEVVQDAFLYLMTTLPELDSELGVLRFLKWKVRLLSIDVLRAGGRFSPVALDDVDELQFLSEDVAQSIEQADDAAVVALALARLNPRHREALIATLYEEKPHSSVANQMGLSENAFRQLLFRARRAFKVSLLGEGSHDGKTASELLSIALKKAATSGVGQRNLGLLLITLLSVAAFLPTSFGETDKSMQASVSKELGIASPEDKRFPRGTISSPSSNEGTTPTLIGPLEPELPYLQTVRSITPESVVQAALVEVEATSRALGQAMIEEEEVSQLSETFSERLETSLVASREDLSAELMTQGPPEINDSSRTELKILLPSGINVAVLIDLNSINLVEFMQFTMQVGDNQVVGFAQQGMAVIEESKGSPTLYYAAADFLVGDFGGGFDFLSIELGGTNNLIFELEIELPSHGGEFRVEKAEFRSSAVPAS